MIKLTKHDNSATVEESIVDLCHLATPNVFCRSQNLLVVDCGNYDWNPYQYVKINGRFGLLTANRNFGRADSQHWWYNRDPSRDFEFMFWHSTGPTDSNKIFLYWSDLDNLPEVEYAQRDDCAIHANGLQNATIRLHCERAGYGIRMWECESNVIELSGDTLGVGLRMEKSHRNRIASANLSNLGRRGVALTRESSENEIGLYQFTDSGLNESIEGSLFFSSGAHNNKAYRVVGSSATYGRFWPLDGSAISFGETATGNLVVDAIISDSFNAVQDNSGHPGNRIFSLTTINCYNSFDQVDFKAMGENQAARMAGWGRSDPIEKVIGRLTAIKSGPFGVRTRSLRDIKEVNVLGASPPFRWRWAHPYYPDLPGYEDWNFRRDAVNPQAVPETLP